MVSPKYETYGNSQNVTPTFLRYLHLLKSLVIICENWAVWLLQYCITPKARQCRLPSLQFRETVHARLRKFCCSVDENCFRMCFCAKQTTYARERAAGTHRKLHAAGWVGYTSPSLWYGLIKACDVALLSEWSSAQSYLIRSGADWGTSFLSCASCFQ